MDLRPYQTEVINKVEQLVEQGERSILLVAPTGSGKTVIASAIIRGRPRKALVIAHRREIVNQTAAKLDAFGVYHGVIQAGDERKLRPMAPVQVASIHAGGRLLHLGQAHQKDGAVSADDRPRVAARREQDRCDCA